MQTVNVAIYIAIAVCGVFGALMGLRKGLYKSLINLGVVLTSAGISFALAKLVTKLMVSEEEILSGLDMLTASNPEGMELLANVKETILGLSEQGNAVGMAMALPTIIITPLVFMIIYLVVGLLLKIPEVIVCRSIFGKNGGESYHGGSRIGGAAVRAVTKILSLAIFLIPLIGYISFANDVLTDVGEVGAVTTEEGSESVAEPMSDKTTTEDAGASVDDTVSSISDTCEQIRVDYISPINDNFAVKAVYVCGGRWFFNSLTSTRVEGVKITLRDETKVLTNVYKDAIVLLEAPVAEYGEEQATAITNITNTLDEAVVVPSIVSGVISYVSDAWLNGEEVFGYGKINVGDYYEPTFNKILTIFSETTNDTISQDIHTAGNLVNICIEQGFFKETFGGGSPMTVIQREEFMGEIFVELYLNDTTRPFVADIVNAFKNYIYRVYNEVNGTNVPYPQQLVMENVTQEMMYAEGALISSILRDFVAFYESLDQNETDNTKIIINTDLRSLGRALDTLKTSLFIGDSYDFILEAILRSEGASQFAFLTPEFIEVMLATDSSMETILVARQHLAVIASVKDAEHREIAIEHLLKNIDSDTAEVIIETLTPQVLQNLGMSTSQSNAMSGTLGSIVQEIANQDGEFTEEEISTEINAVDKIVSTVQSATNGDNTSNLFASGEDDTASKSGMTASELVDTVVNSKIVSSAVTSSATDEEGNAVENPYGISDKLTESDKSSAKSAIEDYYSENAVADDDNAELKATLDSLASIFGVDVNLGE